MECDPTVLVRGNILRPDLNTLFFRDITTRVIAFNGNFWTFVRLAVGVSGLHVAARTPKQQQIPDKSAVQDIESNYSEANSIIFQKRAVV